MFVDKIDDQYYQIYKVSEDREKFFWEFFYSKWFKYERNIIVFPRNFKRKIVKKDNVSVVRIKKIKDWQQRRDVWHQFFTCLIQYHKKIKGLRYTILTHPELVQECGPSTTWAFTFDEPTNLAEVLNNNHQLSLDITGQVAQEILMHQDNKVYDLDPNTYVEFLLPIYKITSISVVGWY